MTVKPKYYFNLDENIIDGEKEYSLYNIEDRIEGLSINSNLKERYVLYGRNSLLDLLNELHEENQFLLHIIDWCLTHHKEVGHIVFNSRDEFFIWLKEKGVLE